MPSTPEDEFWEILLRRIERGACTPFLGAGASGETIPLGSQIARRWAGDEYPLWDADDLARVAQYVAVKHDDPMWPKEKIQALFEEFAPPPLTLPDDPYAVLANLPLPIYLTTNYDDFIVRALRACGKQPVREFCRWTPRPSFRARPSAFDDPDFVPTPERPLVYHLHGQIDLPESLVLTENDYVDFLVNMARDDIVPPLIEGALADTMLLFVGYRLADWNFRVLYRGLVEKRIDPSGRHRNMTVQLPPDVPSPEAARQYLDQYFGDMRVQVFWGDAREFARRLHGRWEQWNGR